MTPDAAPFEAFYGSSLQHPILLWLAAATACAWCLSRRGLSPSAARYCALLTALSALDAWLTADHVYGLGMLPGWASGAVPLFFVLAGDYRFLFLFGAATPRGDVVPAPRAFAAAAGLTVLVPVFSQVLVSLLPVGSSEPRVLFLVYELAFFGLTLALRTWHPRARAVPWLAPVSGLVLVYYGLWAAADALLLATGSDIGFALRVIPNVLYYGGLIAVIGSAAARAARG